MANEKPLTKSALIAALKEIGVTTQDDLDKLRDDINEDFLVTLAEFYSGEIKPDLTKFELAISSLKGERDGLKEELSDTPSRREFNNLKKRVDEYQPSSN